MSGATHDGSSRGWPSRRLHFIGIGGAGMSGLALVCHELGARVTGSDRSDSSYIERLRAAGLAPAIGHDGAGVPDDAEVVVSTAIAADNPELERAHEYGLAVLHRGELLAELCGQKRLIAVAGTHGKTTTSAMVAWALRSLGAEPAFFVGGEVPGLGPGGETANAGWGDGEWGVAEADESDASFLRLQPEVAVVTNVEMDHHSRWGSLAELTEAFAEFIEPATGVVLPAAAGSEGRAGGEPIDRTGGRFDRATQTKTVIRFDASTPGPQQLALRTPGTHNLRNARAALAALSLAGFDPAKAAVGLEGFPGVARRLEFKGVCRGARLYDDYAHHPTEVRAALEAVREMGPAQVLAVFQPHLYSRTQALAEQFGAALALADEVVVLDVYPAREEPVGRLAGVSGLDVARAAADRMGGRRVSWVPTLEQVRATLEPRLEPGVVAVTIGAGDVFRLAEALAEDRGAAR